MDDYMTKTLNDFAKDILEDGVIDAEEVQCIQKRIYEDNVIDREEADFLFELNDGVSGAANDPSWKELFVKALTDHVTKDIESPGVVDEDEASYLIEKIKGDNKVDDVELALLVNITSTAKECHESFNTFVLESVKAAILEDGIIDDEEVEMIKKVIYGTGGGAGEADWLIERIEGDDVYDENEKALLTYIKANAKEVNEKLKSKMTAQNIE